MKTIVIDARKMKSTTGRVVEELVRKFDETDRAHTYKVLVYPEELDYYTPVHPNIQMIAADFKHYTFGEQIGLALLLYKLRPDIVFFHMPQQPLLYFGKSVTLVHDLNLLRITANDMGPVELVVKKAIFTLLLWIIAARATHIITPTKFTKDDLVAFSRISPKKVTVAYNGMIDVGAPVPVPAFKNKRFIVYLGRAEPYKNNRRLIEAHQRLLTLYPDLHLIIVGGIDDLRKADMAWVKQQKYRHVHFLGYLSDEEAAWLYQRCEAFVQPSLMEGFGMPVLEAMQQGAPVASTNATCCPEVYGDAAHYFDPLSTDDIERAINDILSDTKLRQSLIDKGKEQAKKYSWVRQAEQVLTVLKKALGE